MKRAAFAVILAGLLVATVSLAATTDVTPSQQIAKLKQQLRVANGKVSDQQDEIDAQDALLSDQTDTIARLRNRIANQPAPLDVITSGSPDDLWAAMRAIWLAMPALDPGQLCGYDKSQVPGEGDGLTLTTYSFFSWRGC